MKPDWLLKHFEQISEAPDAVPRLRRFILNLAVRGKLVEQNPNDEPATEILKRIKKDILKNELIASSSKDYDPPFEIQNSWIWAQIGEIAFVEMGQSPPSEYYNKSVDGLPFYQGKSDFGKRNPTPRCWCSQPTKLAKKDDILISVRAPVGPTNVSSETCCIGRGLAAIRPHKGVDLEWFLYWLKGFELKIAEMGFGTTFIAINKKQLVAFPLPLPPLAEQHRIVAKVDELMALCDELEASQTKRENRRDRLVAATLHGLSNGDGNGESGNYTTFKESARFYFSNLPRLTIRPEHIQQLRQTILNLAVRGKLVQQNPKDKLADRIKIIELSKGDAPFSIPENWRWTRFGCLGQIQGGGTPSKNRPDYWDGDIPWVSPKDMKKDHINSSALRISSKALDESSVKLIQQGSILFVVRGMILAHSFPVALSMISVTVNQDMKALTLTLPAMGEFVLRGLMGLREIILSKVLRSSHGTCRLESVSYTELCFPLPPLAEQHRIVSKVDELMALCDELESQITNTTATRRQLLEASLHEALSA